MPVLGDPSFRADPVLGHNFLISLVDSSSTLALLGSVASAIGQNIVGGFSECSGLDMSLDVEDREEGGRNGEVLKFPTRVKWSNIILKKGVGLSKDLWNWHYSFVEGRGRRRDGVIVLQDSQRRPHNVWHFRRGLPFKYTGPAMNASQNNVAIEVLEIAHEGLTQLPSVGLGIAAVESLVSTARDIFG
jgi:phage tail-like protein